MTETMASELKVTIIGSGSWASYVAGHVGLNACRHNEFNDSVYMYVHEEILEYNSKRRQRLSSCINSTHVNKIYLDEYELPENVVAKTSILEAVSDADIIIFAFNVKSVDYVMSKLEGNLKPECFGISLVKGFYEKGEGELGFVSDRISEKLGIPCASLTAANLNQRLKHGTFCKVFIVFDLRFWPLT